MAAIVFDPYASKFRDASSDELLDQDVGAGDYFGVTVGDRGYVWFFDGAGAFRVGIVTPDAKTSGMVALEPGESLRQALCRVPMLAGQSFVIHRMELPPGGYYPRIARPIDQHPLEAPGYQHHGVAPSSYELISSLSQMRALVSLLEQIFQTVQPSKANLKCFGSDIRNLIILASTECETHWRAVLKANNYKANRKSARLTTDDYVKLVPAMRLNEYGVVLTQYPWMPAITPFADWHSSRPTQSLDWYDGYNAVKHDRESFFEEASLENAIKSVAATWVMIAAEFGFPGLREFSDLRDYFRLDRVPRWRYSEVYTVRYQGHLAGAGPRAYPF